MNSSRFQKLWHSVGLMPLLLTPIAAVAAEPTTPAAPTTAATTPQLDEARRFLNVSRLQKAFNEPLDLKVENATVEDIAGRVQKALLVRKVQPAPRIEVRNVLSTRLSFDRKGSTAVGILSSTAALAGAQLWFFSDHVLVAPMQSLSPDEMKQVQSGAASTSSARSRRLPLAPSNAKRNAFSALVAQEIGTRLGITGLGSATAATNESQQSEWPPKVDKVSVNQLSPDARSALQEIVADINEHIQESHRQMGIPSVNVSSFTLTGESQVGLSSREGGALVLNFPETGATMTWTTDGTRITTGGGGLPPKTSTPAPRPPLPLDPSAGKS